MTVLLSTIQIKEQFSELINRVSHDKERIIITRRDKEIAAIIPIEDLYLLQNSQDKQDLEQALESLKEARNQGTSSLDKLKKEIGSP